MKKDTLLALTDSGNPIWLKIYRWYIVVVSSLIFLIGLIGSIHWLSNYGFEIDALMLFLLGTLLAFVHLVINMVFLGLFTNVQRIRIRIENEKNY